MLIQDLVKLALYALVENRATHNRRFLEIANRPVRSHPVR